VKASDKSETWLGGVKSQHIKTLYRSRVKGLQGERRLAIDSGDKRRETGERQKDLDLHHVGGGPTGVGGL